MPGSNSAIEAVLQSITRLGELISQGILDLKAVESDSA